MTSFWIVLIPPLLVIASVMATRQIILSFLLGILASGLIVSQGNVSEALSISGYYLWVSTGLSTVSTISGLLGSWNLLIFLFLICLGIIIVLLSESGAAQAYIRIVSNRVHSKKEAEGASLFLSLFFFIDDYFSALTVGSVMRPLAIAHNVHPIKLAFLTTAMATPLTLISPLSSWVGEIVLQLKQVGITAEEPKTVVVADPYLLFTYSIPYLLYPLLLIVCTWYIVIRGISYGPMRKYDLKVSNAHPKAPHIDKKASFIDFLVPIFTLVFGVFGMMLYTGNYSFLGGTESFASALKNSSVPGSLLTGGAASVIVSIALYLARGTIKPTKLGHHVLAGSQLMLPSIVMLICAWALGALLKNDLRTGTYIATHVSSIINMELFPVICFLFAALISWLIGSAWATIGLMFPITIELLQRLLDLPPNTPLSSVEILIPLVGATLSGAAMGVHVSVLSDNPIMSAASTRCDHLEHVKSMSWYVLPIALAAAIGFTIIGVKGDTMGLKQALLLGGAVSLLAALIFLELLNYLYAKLFPLKN